MSKVIVNRLRLNGEYVGYRIEATSCSGKTIFFDVSEELFRSFIKLFHTNHVYKGKVVNGREQNGVFVSDNETGVYEVTSWKQGQSLLNRHYFEFTENGWEPAALWDESQYYGKSTYLHSFTNGRVSDVSKCKYGNFGYVPQVYRLLVNSLNDTNCNLLYHIEQSEYEGKLVFDVVFSEFLNGLYFVHNLLKQLGRDTWTPNMEIYYDEWDGASGVKAYRFATGDYAIRFSEILLSMLGINYGEALECNEFSVYGSDGMAEIGIWGKQDEDGLHGELHRFSYEVPIPGYKEVRVNQKDPKFYVEWVTPVSNDGSACASISPKRCETLLSSAVSHLFDDVDCDTVDTLHCIGFYSSDMYNRFGIPVSALKEWFLGIGYEEDEAEKELFKCGKCAISNDRYMQLLNAVINYVYAQEVNPKKTLLKIGFTEDELSDVFKLDMTSE